MSRSSPLLILSLAALSLPSAADARQISAAEWTGGSVSRAGERVELSGSGSLGADVSTRLLRGFDFTLKASGCKADVGFRLDGRMITSWKLRRGETRPASVDVQSAPGMHRIELGFSPRATCSHPRLVVRDASLREWVPIGSDMEWRYVEDDPTLMQLFADETDAITAGLDMQWNYIHPQRDVYDFAAADRIVEFAERHGKVVRGHPLVWHHPWMLPAWLNDGDWTRDELIDVMREHITTIVSRYRGRVDEWDVVNEAVDADGSLRQSFWLKTIGPEYIEMAFRFAHQADPEAKLYYNDYDAETANAHSDGVHALLSGLLARGVPIDGVGFQNHATTGHWPSAEELTANFKRFADIGLEIQISEMDVVDDTAEPDSPERVALQAQAFADAARACRAEPACVRLTTWGLSDQHSWLGAEKRPLPFDHNLEPKPAWHALEQVLRPSEVAGKAKTDVGRKPA